MTLYCGQCKLFNRERSTCDVDLVIRGEIMELNRTPEQNCIFEELGIEIRFQDYIRKDENKKI